MVKISFTKFEPTFASITRRRELSGRRENAPGGNAVDKFWSDCAEAVRFTCEAQTVFSMRVLLLASGDPGAAAEAYRMIAEKAIAFADARAAAERALADGRSVYEAAEEAYAPVRDCVRENSNRLLSAVH
jgi:hypothetical protein